MSQSTKLNLRYLISSVAALEPHLMIKATATINPSMLRANMAPRAMTTAWSGAGLWGFSSTSK